MIYVHKHTPNEFTLLPKHVRYSRKIELTSDKNMADGK